MSVPHVAKAAETFLKMFRYAALGMSDVFFRRSRQLEVRLHC
jgi:hypothetical protein